MNLAIVLGVEPEFVEASAKSYREQGWRASVHYRPRLAPDQVDLKTLTQVAAHIAAGGDLKILALVCDRCDNAAIAVFNKLRSEIGDIVEYRLAIPVVAPKGSA